MVKATLLEFINNNNNNNKLKIKKKQKQKQKQNKKKKTKKRFSAHYFKTNLSEQKARTKTKTVKA